MSAVMGLDMFDWEDFHDILIKSNNMQLREIKRIVDDEIKERKER
tara:strand:+ start:5045 stop:5179 length:135 start_codon:yes stop_codon:yes gene_type:complete